MCVRKAKVDQVDGMLQEPYKRDDILQKMRMILRSLLIVATLYRRVVPQTVYIDV